MRCLVVRTTGTAGGDLTNGSHGGGLLLLLLLLGRTRCCCCCQALLLVTLWSLAATDDGRRMAAVRSMAVSRALRYAMTQFFEGCSTKMTQFLDRKGTMPPRRHVARHKRQKFVIEMLSAADRQRWCIRMGVSDTIRGTFLCMEEAKEKCGAPALNSSCNES